MDRQTDNVNTIGLPPKNKKTNWHNYILVNFVSELINFSLLCFLIFVSYIQTVADRSLRCLAVWKKFHYAITEITNQMQWK